LGDFGILDDNIQMDLKRNKVSTGLTSHNSYNSETVTNIKLPSKAVKFRSA
jgi:hypothetical protein